MELRRTAISAKKSGSVKNMEEFRDGLARKVMVSTAAIKQWENGRNGVSDLDRVKDIAEYLKIEDYRVLLIEKTNEEEIENMPVLCVSDEERRTAREVFNRFVDVLSVFRDTEGYSVFFDKNDDLYKGSDVFRSVDECNNVNKNAEIILQKARFDLTDQTYKELRQLFEEIEFTCFFDEFEDFTERELAAKRKSDEFFEQLCTIMKGYIK